MIYHQKAANYAKALFKSEGSLEQIRQRQQELELLSEIITKNARLSTILGSPQLTLKKKLSLLEQVIEHKLDNSLKNLIGLILKRRQIDAIRQIAAEYHKLVMYYLKEIDVEVCVAKPLTNEEKDLMKKTLQDKFHKKPVVIETVDPTLLGGFTLLAYNKLLDLSVKGKLMNLKKQLLKAKI